MARPSSTGMPGHFVSRVSIERCLLRIDEVAGRDMDLSDDAVDGGLDLVLHLHRLDDDQGLVLPDRFALGDGDLDDLARHGRFDPEPVSAVLSSPSPGRPVSAAGFARRRTPGRRRRRTSAPVPGEIDPDGPAADDGTASRSSEILPDLGFEGRARRRRTTKVPSRFLHGDLPELAVDEVFEFHELSSPPIRQRPSVVQGVAASFFRRPGRGRPSAAAVRGHRHR